MSKHIWHSDLRRSRRSNRLGLTLVVVMTLALVVSIIQGVVALAA